MSFANKSPPIQRIALERNVSGSKQYNPLVLSPLFPNDIPQEHRWNFIHLYFDIGWYGILAGSAVNFLNIYATRLGANGFEIGLLTAMGAIVSLTLAIPAGHWIEARPIGKAVFWSSVI